MMEEELYPGEKDALGAVVYTISRRIILEDLDSSPEARHIAAQAVGWAEAESAMKADCIRVAWAVRQKVLEDHGGLVAPPEEIPS